MSIEFKDKDIQHEYDELKAREDELISALEDVEDRIEQIELHEERE